MNEKPTLYQLALAAMQAIVAHDGYSETSRDEIARHAYDLAEAMLAEADRRGHKRSDIFE